MCDFYTNKITSKGLFQGISGIYNLGNKAKVEALIAIHADKTGTLANMVNGFKNSTDYIEKRIFVKRILYFITDSASVVSSSRGGNIDARDLHVVKKFMGRDFVGIGGSSPMEMGATISLMAEKTMTTCLAVPMMIHTSLTRAAVQISLMTIRAELSLKQRAALCFLTLAFRPLAAKQL